MTVEILITHIYHLMVTDIQYRDIAVRNDLADFLSWKNAQIHFT